MPKIITDSCAPKGRGDVKITVGWVKPDKNCYYRINKPCCISILFKIPVLEKKRRKYLTISSEDYPSDT